MPFVGGNIFEVMGCKHQQSITCYSVLNVNVSNNCYLKHIQWVQELLPAEIDAQHAFCQWLRILLSYITPVDRLMQTHK